MRIDSEARWRGKNFLFPILSPLEKQGAPRLTEANQQHFLLFLGSPQALGLKLEAPWLPGPLGSLGLPGWG